MSPKRYVTVHKPQKLAIEDKRYGEAVFSGCERNIDLDIYDELGAHLLGFYLTLDDITDIIDGLKTLKEGIS